MLGRSNRSRGICDGLLFVNTGEDEKTYLRRIRMMNFSEAKNLIELLALLSNVQANPFKTEQVKLGKGLVSKTRVMPEVKALHQAYVDNIWIVCIRELLRRTMLV